jgi:hypothetical protein
MVYIIPAVSKAAPQKPDPLPEMNAGLFALLRFLRHELERSLEHADLHLEGLDELDVEGKERAGEVGDALLEGIEFTQGYLLDAFAALGDLRPERAEMPTPGGQRTVAVIRLRPHENARDCLGLGAGEEVLFDGIFAYLQDARGGCRAWMEIGDQPLPVATGGPGPGKLPVVR